MKAIFSVTLRNALSNLNPSIQQLCDAIVETTVDLYGRISSAFRPVPQTIHYSFNTNELAKCVRSLQRAEPNVYTQPLQFLRFFRHECDRIFCDRLTTTADATRGQDILKDVFAAHFNEPIVADIEQLLFADFVHPLKHSDHRKYVEIRDVDKLKTIIGEYLIDMNKDVERKENIMLFQSTVEHLLRIVRILRIVDENGLIMGNVKRNKECISFFMTCKYFDL